jgi:hypothetical protein
MQEEIKQLIIQRYFDEWIKTKKGKEMLKKFENAKIQYYKYGCVLPQKDEITKEEKRLFGIIVKCAKTPFKTNANKRNKKII